jgi:hypothetical protein
VVNIENTSSYPALCRGTFFTLELEARKAKTETEMHAGLIRIVHPEFRAPESEKLFKTNTSDIKLCKNNGGALAFTDMEIWAFDRRVKHDYGTVLARMVDYINQFIDVGGSVKRDEWLVRALLDLIIRDDSIDDDDVFYALGDGAPITKSALRTATEICFPAFLLGVWHFAVVSRRDNTIGRETIDRWCPPNNRNPRAYTGDMGAGVTREIKLTFPTLDDIPESGPVAGDNARKEYAWGHDGRHRYKPRGQTINMFNHSTSMFFGNGRQIINNGVMNIRREKRNHDQ